MKTLQQIANDMYANHGERDAQIIQRAVHHIAELEAENERLRLVRDAASCIYHWHDSGEDGMVVSAEHVRKLWSALDAAQEGE